MFLVFESIYGVKNSTAFGVVIHRSSHIGTEKGLVHCYTLLMRAELIKITCFITPRAHDDITNKVTNLVCLKFNSIKSSQVCIRKVYIDSVSFEVVIFIVVVESVARTDICSIQFNTIVGNSNCPV